MDSITVKEKKKKEEEEEKKSDDGSQHAQESIVSRMESHQPELIIHILSRVPTLDMPKLRYVCKRWNNILKDPLFHRLHLCHSMSNENRVLLLKRGSRLFFVDLSDITSPREIALDLPYVPDNFPNYYSIDSCNGLLCLKGIHTQIFILNPFTRQHLCIFVPQKRVLSWGFGFDQISKLFKVMVFVGVSSRDKKNNYVRNVGAIICDLGSGGSTNWRNIGMPDYNIEGLPGCFFNGRLHWYCWKGDSHGILSFDLADEEFRFTPAPDDCPLPKFRYRFFASNTNMFVLKGCLFIFQNQAFSLETLRVQVWAMKECGVVVSWIKIIDTQTVMPRSLSHELRTRQGCSILHKLGFLKDGKLVIATHEGAILISSDLTFNDLKLLPIERLKDPGHLIVHTCSLNWI